MLRDKKIKTDKNILMIKDKRSEERSICEASEIFMTLVKFV